ncbi:uncharacterized protein FA14DRAFT_161302 [Meira miltonrushii]|uniref:Uncharacterized protein n=1 Tax=Meira miltonrushii TaxID=1280837 RepID=A0A316V775_9BASI|nr:uncharacterized protein FA14DRAFT_161302 [Meira miltonrushii]PWN33469.1 hypothetical protein FA14DRAFT_161302 [Meira miltonrushii]
MTQRRKDSQILVIPATSAQACVSQAQRIVHLIIDEDKGNSPSQQDIESIPWHISNRYYDVDVHFRISQNEALRPTRSIGSSSKSRLAPRQARLKPEHSDKQAKEDNDDALNQKARDVFAALELGPPPASRDAIASASLPDTDTESMDNMREEVRDVQAVMVIVDRDQSLAEHRKLIDRLNSEKDDIPLLSGFDLAISLIVALPSPLNDASGPTSFTGISHSAEVEDLYAGEGWEYVDLAKIVSDDYDNMLAADEGDEETSSLSEHEDDEKHGIERLREALMTHAWPGLERKQDRKHATTSIQPGGLPALNGETGDHLSKTLESLRLDLDAIDEAGMTQPTEKDEELARLFMARIQAAQEAGIGSSVQQNGANPTLAGDRSIADMQTALEDFLESNEPGLFSTQSRQNSSHIDEAWAVNGTQANSSSQQEAFDDDFTEFVQADATHSANCVGTNALDSLDEDDLGFIGDADDAFLLRALSEQEKSRGGNNGQSHAADSAGLNIDFESTLQAVLAQAERVRAIPDHDRRREEAAKVALALLDQ